MDSTSITLYIGGALMMIVSIIGLVWFFSGLARLMHGRFLNGPGRSLAGLVLLLLVAFITLLVLDLRTYFTLTHEQLVASVRFDAIGPPVFSCAARECQWARDPNGSAR